MSQIWLDKLANLKHKQTKRIIGCLSGTSMDGLDLAICDITGNGTNSTFQILHTITISYPTEILAELARIAFNENIHMPTLCSLNSRLGIWIGEMVLKECTAAGILVETIDAVASHGQTIFHAPANDASGISGTLQIGDGDHISRVCGIPVISDFRQKHLAAGGEGAPLAPYFDWLVCHSQNSNRILLNIGGISNFTWLKSDLNFEDVITGDTGPGNTLMDEATKHYFNQPFDRDGDFARQGTVSKPLLVRFLSHPYFIRPFPKSTGQELFSKEWMMNCITETTPDINGFDLLATLTELTAQSIADAIKTFLHQTSTEIFASGGGLKNTVLMELLTTKTGISVKSTQTLGIHPDFKEALIFAILANETLTGAGWPSPDGNSSVTFGKISLL